MQYTEAAFQERRPFTGHRSVQRAKRSRTPALAYTKFTLGLVPKSEPLNTLLMATS